MWHLCEAVVSGKCSAQMYQKKQDGTNFLPAMSSVGLDIYRCFLTTTDLMPLRESPLRFFLNRKSCLQAPRSNMKIQTVIFNSRVFLQLFYFSCSGICFSWSSKKSYIPWVKQCLQWIKVVEFGLWWKPKLWVSSLSHCSCSVQTGETAIEIIDCFVPVKPRGKDLVFCWWYLPNVTIFKFSSCYLCKTDSVL